MERCTKSFLKMEACPHVSDSTFPKHREEKQDIGICFCSKDFHLVNEAKVFTFFIEPGEELPLHLTFCPNALLKMKHSVVFMNNTFIYKQLISPFVTDAAQRALIRRQG